MIEYLPHIVLIALIVGASVLFFQKGSERRDLLTMGLATGFAALWMASVVMIDYTVQEEAQLPIFWLALSANALLPALFFIYLSVLQLESYYDPTRVVMRKDWLPLAVAVAALGVAHIIEPELFYREVTLHAPRTDKLVLDPTHTLHFSLGLGYFVFLGLAAYAMYGIAVRFPRIVEAMALPEAERRTRMLLSLGMLAAFWGAAFDILPTLFSTTMPSFMRLVGPALGVAGAFYAMVLSRALDAKAVFRSTLFYVIRVLVIAVPAIVAVANYKDELAALSPRWTMAVVLAGIMVIDLASLRLKPLLDWLALRRSYNSAEVISRYVHDLLVLRDARDITQTVRRFVGGTLGVPDLVLWMPPIDNPKAFYNIDDDKRLVLNDATRRALVQRDCATNPGDAQLDPRLFPVRDEFEALFTELTAEVVLPLVDEGRLIGLLSLGYKESFDEYYEQDLQFLDTLRRSTTLSLSNTLQYELARTGKPVKVYSREEFDEAVARQWAQARRSNEALSLVLLRLDDAERFDKEYGAGKAAAMVKELGDKLRPTLRGRDLPAFFDAHTIGMLLPHTTEQGAEIAGRRIRVWLESNAVEIDGDTVLGKFKLGIATRTETMPGPADLCTEAEEALADATVAVRN